MMVQFQNVAPISNEDLSALPVKELERAINFYRTALGFSVVSQDATTARLTRDDVQIGLIQDPNHQPGNAGSIAIAIHDLDALHLELQDKGHDLGGFRFDHWNNKRYRVFFFREFVEGYCYCFHHAMS